MTTTPIAAGPNDVTVRTRFEQWYLRDLRGNPANLELDENGEYKYLPTLLLAFAAGEKTEREACAKACETTALHNGDFLKNSDPRKTCADAIRERSNADVTGLAPQKD